MLDLIKNEVIKVVMTVRIQSREEIEAAEESMAGGSPINVNYQHADFDPEAAPEELLAPTVQAGSGDDGSEYAKVGRNDPCPCGSGKKYKQCHGKLA